MFHAVSSDFKSQKTQLSAQNLFSSQPKESNAKIVLACEKLAFDSRNENFSQVPVPVHKFEESNGKGT